MRKHAFVSENDGSCNAIIQNNSIITAAVETIMKTSINRLIIPQHAQLK